MTDSPQVSGQPQERWQAPGFAPSTAGGQAAPPSYTPAPQHAGWAPPPKPGLIPLRPLSFGTILAAPYQALRRNPRPTFGVSLLFQSITAILFVIVIGAVTAIGISRAVSVTDSSAEEDIIAGSVAAILAAAAIPALFSIVASALMQGIVVLEVARQILGERQRFGQLWTRAKGRAWAIVGFTALYALAAVMAFAVAIGIAVAISFLGDAAVVAGVLLGVVLVLGLIVLAAWLGTKLAFVPSIMMLERKSMPAAIARSFSLTNGAFWRIFGTLLLVAVILSTAQSIVTAPLQIAQSFAITLLSPTQELEPAIAVVAVISVLAVVISVVIGSIALIIQSTTTALVYIDQRMRREGLDLDLVRFVEARQTGDDSVGDPFETA